MQPRLLTDRDAAVYLSIPIAGVRKVEAGRVVIDGRVRWDRVALDEWLDTLIGRKSGIAPANQNGSTADDELAAWLADQNHAPRHS